MKKHFAALFPLLLAVVLHAVATPAGASEHIVRKARCVTCHSVDAKRIGPAHREVAARYRSDAGAPARLFEKIRQGGAGSWGDVPMMPHPADSISDDDLKAVIAWILSLS